MNTLYHTTYESPLGPVLLLGTATHLRGLYFVGQKRQPALTAESVASDAPFLEVKRQLDAYFEGGSEGFDVPLELAGTPFQQTVWRALQAIPRGQTVTYAQLAQSIGRPTATRAVALAGP